MTGVACTFKDRLRGLLLTGVGLVAIMGGIEDVRAQSLPWPDANPVMRIDRPSSRAHRSRPHRAVRRHAIRPKRVLKPVASATALKPVSPDSAKAESAPSIVPLPTQRATSAPDGPAAKAETSSSGPAAETSPEAAARSAKASDGQQPLTTSNPARDAPASSPERAKSGEPAQAAAAADRPALPAEADVPKPERAPVEQTKPGDVTPSKPEAIDAGSLPAPKPAEGSKAAIARSGLDAAEPKSETPQNSGVTSKTGTPEPDTDGAGARSGKSDETSTRPAVVAPMKRNPNSDESLPIDNIPLPVQRPDAPPTPGATSGASERAPKADAPNSTEKLKSRVPEMTPAAMVQAAAAIEDARNCEAELKQRGAIFTVGESIAEGECGVLRPVEMKTLSSGVSITPSTVLLCRAALALDEWMSDSVVPAAKAAFPDDKLKTFRHASTYVCRPRASEAGISEHARGSAIDIGGFTLASGRNLGIAAQKDGSPEAQFQHAIREAACGPFKTVLGPGTNSDHATHFHLDIAARRNGATYCK